MRVHPYGSEYDPPTTNPPSPVVHALSENKRPIGFTAWSTKDETPPRKPRKPRRRAQVEK